MPTVPSRRLSKATLPATGDQAGFSVTVAPPGDLPAAAIIEPSVATSLPPARPPTETAFFPARRSTVPESSPPGSAQTSVEPAPASDARCMTCLPPQSCPRQANSLKPTATSRLPGRPVTTSRPSDELENPSTTQMARLPASASAEVSTPAPASCGEHVSPVAGVSEYRRPVARTCRWTNGQEPEVVQAILEPSCAKATIGCFSVRRVRGGTSPWLLAALATA